MKLKNIFLFKGLYFYIFTTAILVLLNFFLWFNIVFFIILVIYSLFLIIKVNWKFILILITPFLILLPKIIEKSPDIQTGESQNIVLKVNSLKGSYFISSDKESMNVLAYYSSFKDISINYGDEIYIEGEYQKINEPLNNSSFDFQKYMEYNNVYYSIKVTKVLNIIHHANPKAWFYSFINNIKNENVRSFLKLLILNQSDDINGEIFDGFKNLNIIHILVISGFHIGILFAFLSFIFKKLNFYLKNIIVFSILLFFIYIINFPFAVTRAFLFLFFLQINKKLKVNFLRIDVLSMVGIIFLIINPFTIFLLGFQLSFLITFLIIFTRKYLKDKSKIFNLVYISILSWMLSGIFLIAQNYEVNFLGWIFNIVFSPIIGFYFIFFLFTFFMPFMYPFLNILVEFLFAVNKFANSLDTTIVVGQISRLLSIIIFVILILIILLWTKKKKKNNWKNYVKITLFPMVWSSGLYFINFFSPVMGIDVINVGQAQSILIHDKFNKNNILIDAGSPINQTLDMGEREIIPYLKSKAIKSLDCLFITHKDKDHSGSASTIINQYPSVKIYDHTNMQQMYKVGNFIFENINYLNKQDDNNGALTLFLHYYNFKFLFCSDTDSNIEKQFIKDEDIRNLDLLIVPHHGSRFSSSKEFVEFTHPKYAVISVGKNNYGHPNSEVIKRYLSVNAKLYTTKENGNITISISSSNINIEHFKPKK